MKKKIKFAVALLAFPVLLISALAIGQGNLTPPLTIVPTWTVTGTSNTLGESRDGVHSETLPSGLTSDWDPWGGGPPTPIVRVNVDAANSTIDGIKIPSLVCAGPESAYRIPRLRLQHSATNHGRLIIVGAEGSVSASNAQIYLPGNSKTSVSISHRQAIDLEYNCGSSKWQIVGNWGPVVDGHFSFADSLTDTTLGATVDNYCPDPAPDGNSIYDVPVLRLGPAAGVSTLTGMCPVLVDSTSHLQGIRCFYALGTLVIPNNSGLSLAGNKFLTPDGHDMVLRSNQGVCWRYDEQQAYYVPAFGGPGVGAIASSTANMSIRWNNLDEFANGCWGDTGTALTTSCTVGGSGIAFVFDLAATGGVLQNNATGNAAAGADAFSAGASCTASGSFSFAEGNGSTASGNLGAAALGSSTAAGDMSFSANVGFANGNQSVAVNNGFSTGDNSFSGNVSEADGQYSAAFNGAHAVGIDSFAIGESSKSTRRSQSSRDSGHFAAEGDAQTSQLELRGLTAGGGAGESVELGFGTPGTSTLQLENGRGYTIVYTAIARGTIAGTPRVQSFKQTLSLSRDAGLSVLTGSGVQEKIGDAAATTWTLAATIGAAPDRVVLTFTTGATTSAARVVAHVEFVEVSNP